jgi:hypothetical protein
VDHGGGSPNCVPREHSPALSAPRCLTIVALDERVADCSLRSPLFDSLASELGRSADQGRRIRT